MDNSLNYIETFDPGRGLQHPPAAALDLPGGAGVQPRRQALGGRAESAFSSARKGGGGPLLSCASPRGEALVGAGLDRGGERSSAEARGTLCSAGSLGEPPETCGNSWENAAPESCNSSFWRYRWYLRVIELITILAVVLPLIQSTEEPPIDWHTSAVLENLFDAIFLLEVLVIYA